MPCAITLTDYQTQEYLYHNGKAEEFSGYPDGTFLKRGLLFWVSLIHPGDMDEIANHSFAKLLDTLHNLTVEEIKQCKFSYSYRVKKKDGTYIKVLQNSVVLEMDRQRNPLLLLTLVADITPFKKG